MDILRNLNIPDLTRKLEILGWYNVKVKYFTNEHVFYKHLVITSQHLGPLALVISGFYCIFFFLKGLANTWPLMHVCLEQWFSTSVPLNFSVSRNFWSVPPLRLAVVSPKLKIIYFFYISLSFDTTFNPNIYLIIWTEEVSNSNILQNAECPMIIL